jgi:hypothetical protein
VGKYRWHAEYFLNTGSLACTKRTIIEADNACEAEKAAKAQMGQFARVEVRRVATAAPIRVIHAARISAEIKAPAEILSLKNVIPAVSVIG